MNCGQPLDGHGRINVEVTQHTTHHSSPVNGAVLDLQSNVIALNIVLHSSPGEQHGEYPNSGSTGHLVAALRSLSFDNLEELVDGMVDIEAHVQNAATADETEHLASRKLSRDDTEPVVVLDYPRRLVMGFGFTEPLVHQMGGQLCGPLLGVQLRAVPVSLSRPRTFVLNRESCDVCRQTDGRLFD